MRLIGLVLALGLFAEPLVAEGQQAAKIPRLGYLVVAPLSETPSSERAAFIAGLRELGWIEGKTVAIETGRQCDGNVIDVPRVGLEAA